MFTRKATIKVTVKLYSGLDRLATANHYDPETGIELEVAASIKLKRVAKKIGLKKHHAIVFFINGKEAKPKERLKDGDVVFCMKPFSGG